MVHLYHYEYLNHLCNDKKKQLLTSASLINQFHATIIFLCFLKVRKHLHPRFFRGYRKRQVAWNGYVQKQSPEGVLWKVALKNFTTFTGKYLSWIVFFNKTIFATCHIPDVWLGCGFDWADKKLSLLSRIFAKNRYNAHITFL